MSQDNTIVIRFLLNVSTEEPAFVDVEFGDDKQVKRALNTVLSANGALVTLNNVDNMPILIRTEHVAAAFPIEYDDESEEDEE